MFVISNNAKIYTFFLISKFLSVKYLLKLSYLLKISKASSAI
jgi:hypothetical protein